MTSTTNLKQRQSLEFPSDYFHSDHHLELFCEAVNEKWRKEYERRGGPIFRCQMSFITDEGYPSGTKMYRLINI
jgi:hypothetical protein